MQSQAETVRLMGDVLRKNYGDQVTIKYIDVIDDDMDDYAEIEQYLRKSGMVLPLLTVNGQIVRPGIGLSYLEISEELEEMGILKS